MTVSPSPFSRREFLRSIGGGCGLLALASLLETEGRSQSAVASEPNTGGGPGEPPLPRAKRVIWLFMHGGPSHVDLFDPKPDLERLAGQPLPASFGPVTTRRKVAQNPLLGPVRPLLPRGASGLHVSEFLPELARHADDLCVLRSCHGDSVNHPQSVYQMNTGSILMGKPSVGSWVAYGLGTENQDLPAFLVLPDPGGGLKGGPQAWGSGFLPATYQGTPMRRGASPILNLRPAGNPSRDRQRAALDFVRESNRQHLVQRERDGELAARIESYELAFRMQAAAPELVDLSGETAATQAMYGIGQGETDEFGTRCLLARRLVERGVRFVQLIAGDTVGWDAHENVEANHGDWGRRTDKPVAALLTDLKRRGLWDDTLVIWGGEFGRMPMSEQGRGRDHNPWGYSVWLSGGCVRGGLAHGETDAIGLRAAVDKVHVHDLHATILHLLGLDHERLTFFHNGREERLTDVAGRVVHEVLA